MYLHFLPSKLVCVEDELIILVTMVIIVIQDRINLFCRNSLSACFAMYVQSSACQRVTRRRNHITAALFLVEAHMPDFDNCITLHFDLC